MSTVDSGNVVELLLAHRHSSRPALLDGVRVISHAGLYQRVLAVADRIKRTAWAPGSVVCLFGANSIDFVIWYLATISAGGVVFPMSLRESHRVLRSALAVEGVRLVVLDASAPDWLAREATRIVGAEQVIPIAEPAGQPDSVAAPSPPAKVALRTTPALLLMTSGSTGQPKCVELSHANIVANTRSIIAYLRLSQTDRVLAVLPLHYSFGLSLLHTHLAVGASVVLVRDLHVPEAVVAELDRKQCTGFAGVPSTYQLLLRRSRFGQTPLPRLRILQQAGGRLAPRLVAELRDAAPHARLFVMYGTTEATARLSYVPPEQLAHKPGSIGIPIPGVCLEVVAEDGSAVADGEVGELVARGANVFMGYRGDPELTRDKLRSGALHTGDLAYRDGDGYYFIVDRKASFIKSFGFRVSPREIEDAIWDIDGFKPIEVRVIGVPDDDAGERIVALVVKSPDDATTANHVQAECGKCLPSYKIPAEIRFVEALPKGAAGKASLHPGDATWHGGSE